MNAQPHTHRVRFRRSYNYAFSPELDHGGYFVEYGDQRVRYAWAWQRPQRWSPKRLERRVGRATARAVKCHDTSSIRAGEEKAKFHAAARIAEESARRVSSEWART